MTKIVALIQARMSSSRFPGKVLEPLGGKTMMAFMVERARRSKRLDDVVVVTSVDPTDDPLALSLEEDGIPVFRGDLHDVLGRYAKAAEMHEAGVVVRLTGDCPLVDPAIIDQVLAAMLEDGADYASNVEPPTYADGLDVEAFTRSALKLADETAKDLVEREHVTLWMRSERASLTRICHLGLIDSSGIRLTVDYSDDLDLIRRLVELLGGGNDFDYFDVLRVLDHDPALLEINRHARNEGLKQSLSAG